MTSDPTARPGPRNDLTDVLGVGIGHATHPASPTGTTLVAAPAFSAAGVDQRGLAPATRETDALKPANSVGGVHALAFSGGSVFGLAAASGAAEALARVGIGLQVTRNAPPVPIVPAAAIFDLDAAGPDALGEVGSIYAAMGRVAAQRALAASARGDALGSNLSASVRAAAAGRPAAQGLVGAGRGARAAGGLGGAVPGGLGMASLMRGAGPTIAALMVANPVGSPYMPDGRTFWAWPFEIDEEFGGARPDPAAAAAASAAPATKLGPGAPSLNTVIGCVATDADLTAAEATRLATMAQAGVARAVRPAHTPFDGDTLFAFATGARSIGADPAERAAALLTLGADAADCVARAISRGVHIANTVGVEGSATPDGV